MELLLSLKVGERGIFLGNFFFLFFYGVSEGEISDMDKSGAGF